jgi:hypothetical protein
MATITRRAMVGALISAPAALTMGRAFAQDKPVTHKVLVQGKGKVAIVNETGAIEWEAPCPGAAHDLHLLPNGNVLTQTRGNNIVEFDKEKQIVWQYQGKPKEGYDGRVEIHAFQRLPNGNTMVSESGNKRIVEVEKDGKVVKEVPLTVDKPDPHRDTRLVRKLDNGNYLVCHEGDGMVREYDGTGKVVWSYALDLNGRPRTPNHDGHGTEVYGAIRLPNGNTLIGGGNNNRVFEVSPAGKVVWSVEHDELPGIRLYWVTTPCLLPNGNIVFGNCHAGPDNPQIIEVTRDKKVVWKFHQFEQFGNDLVMSQIVGVNGKLIR